MLVAARLRRLTIGLAMFAALASDVAILHGFYVWPKLIAAAFLLAALALVISPRWEEWRRDWRVGALLGALLALGMLAHGASIYGIIPLALIAAFRGLPSWRWIGAAAAGRHRDDGLLVGLPELRRPARQPPGQVASRRASPKSTTAAASRRSSTATAKPASTARSTTSGTTSRTSPASPGRRRHRQHLRRDRATAILSRRSVSIRLYRFFELLPLLGLLLIGPVAMAIRRRRRESEADWSFALTGFVYVGIGLLLLGPAPVGHPGALERDHPRRHARDPADRDLPPAWPGWRPSRPRLAIAVVALNALLVLVVYTPSLTPLPGT